MKVLAGDIGGTNCRLTLCEVEHGSVRPHIEEVVPSEAYESLSVAVREFLAKHSHNIRSACFGLPGPVRGRSVQLTNLPWLVDADAIERDLGIHTVLLVNDLEANAHGLSVLPPERLAILKPGRPDPAGNAALIAAGTGLGEAGLIAKGTERLPFATEGGHTDFAPADSLEIELLGELLQQHEHVSWERVVSGPGLAEIDAFLRRRGDSNAAPAPWALAASTEVPSLIASAARSGSDPVALAAVDLFLALYGAEAGNLALKTFATGGLYVGGGIAPKLAWRFPESRFIERFVAKGRMADLLADIPVYLVLDDRTGLWGAAKLAAARGSGGG